MSQLEMFLNYWAGVDSSLLRYCPHHERQKYITLGVLVLMTGTFAFMASGYAFFTVFESLPVAVLMGLLWGFMIINLDRLLLLTFPKTGPTSRQFLHAVPRLALAVLIGITIAHPISLRLFEPEILSRIADEQEEKRANLTVYRDKAKERTQSEMQRRQQELPEYAEVEQRKRERLEAVTSASKCEVQLSQDKTNYSQEADGTGGSKKTGCKAICEQKKRIYLDTASRCEASRRAISTATASLTDAEHRLSQTTKVIDTLWHKTEEDIDREYQAAVKRLVSFQSRSFLTRSEALGRLANDRKQAATMRFAVSLLLVIVEVVPVLMKILAPVDSADKLASATRDAFFERITDLAQHLADPGALPPPPSVREAEADDMRVVTLVERDSRATVGSLRNRVTAAIVVPIMVTTGLLIAGYSRTDALAVGGFFVPLFAVLVDYDRHRRSTVH